MLNTAQVFGLVHINGLYGICYIVEINSMCDCNSFKSISYFVVVTIQMEKPINTCDSQTGSNTGAR